MACCFHFSNPLPQEGVRFAKWRNVLQMDPAKGSLRIGTPRKGLEFPLWIDLAGGLDHFLFSHIGKNHPKWLSYFYIFFRGVQTTKQLMLIGDFLGVILADFWGSLWPVMGIPIIQWPLLQYCLTQVFVKPIQIIWSFLVFMKLPQGCDCPMRQVYVSNITNHNDVWAEVTFQCDMGYHSRAPWMDKSHMNIREKSRKQHKNTINHTIMIYDVRKISFQ